MTARLLDALGGVLYHRPVARQQALHAALGHQAPEHVQTRQIVAHAPVGPADHRGALGEHHIPRHHERALFHIEAHRVAGMPRQGHHLDGQGHSGKLQRATTQRARRHTQHRRTENPASLLGALGVVEVVVGHRHGGHGEAAPSAGLGDAPDAGGVVGARIHHQAGSVVRSGENPAVGAVVGERRGVGMPHALANAPTMASLSGGAKRALMSRSPRSRAPPRRTVAPPDAAARARRRERSTPHPPRSPPRWK